MPDLPLTVGNYGRSRVDLPQTRLVNSYIEKSPGGPSKVIRTTRPGLTRQYTNGTGPILAMFQQPGIFNGDLFTISGTGFYRNNTLVGTVAFSQNPQIAVANGLMAIVSGGALYIYDGITLAPQLYFDDGYSPLPPFSGVCVLFNIFLYPETGSDKFYFSSVGRPNIINAANFSSAQTAPDQILYMSVLAEEVYIFGQTSVEIWNFTGGLTAPFALSIGRTYARGCAAGASVRKLDNALFWIGDDFVVYRTTQVPYRISTSFIEDRLRKAGTDVSQITTFSANIEGHIHYVINLPSINESYAYDCQTNEWSRWGSQTGINYDPGLFKGALTAGQGEYIFVGSATDGKIWLFDVNNHTDDGTHIQVIVSGSLWIDGGVQKNTNVSLHCVRGVATQETPDPIVEMRYSDDGGRTFTSWIRGHLGRVGSYNYKATWRSLGIFKSPGRLFEFMVADSVNVTIESASWNEARV